jgi:hypothetical protein
MRAVATIEWGYAASPGAAPSGLGRALEGCVVWLRVDGGPSAVASGAGAGPTRGSVCPYEGACTTTGRCHLPRGRHA